MLKTWFATKKTDRIRKGRMPVHIAIIMDGNGRWARKRGLPRVAGHRAGMDAINRTLTALRGLDVRFLTLYAFSTENWRRPKAEVDFLMNLPGQFIDKELKQLIENNVRLNIIGDASRLPNHTQEAINHGIEKTKQNTGLTLNFALNYGSRDEILGAVKGLCRDIDQEKIKADDIDDALFQDYLYTKGIPDPDLMIRTSGEVRISNFLLWQLAYAELFFLDTLWPDFNQNHLYQAIEKFQNRNRRFGGI